MEGVRDDPVPTVVRRYFECANAEAWDELRELWHPGAELETFGADGRRTRRGLERVLAYYDGLFDPWSEHHDEVTRAVDCGDTILAEIEFTGRTPAGRPVSFDVLDVFDLVDGRIQRLSIWHDVLRARAILGL